MNKKANYFSFVGSYHGAVKIKSKWIKAMNLNYINKSNWIRWQGPPSKAIQTALNKKNIINYKQKKGD